MYCPHGVFIISFKVVSTELSKPSIIFLILPFESISTKVGLTGSLNSLIMLLSFANYLKKNGLSKIMKYLFILKILPYRIVFILEAAVVKVDFIL